tara:strand:+ start:229 stop:405 length:177 start_codon:yes stop_codon:yes gene_type:complete
MPKEKRTVLTVRIETKEQVDAFVKYYKGKTGYSITATGFFEKAIKETIERETIKLEEG